MLDQPYLIQFFIYIIKTRNQEMKVKETSAAFPIILKQEMKVKRLVLLFPLS
jgi:hypothetical protein